MRVGVALIAAGLLAAVLLTGQAAATTQANPCLHVHTVAGVKYDTYCGPARVTYHLGARTYRVTGGSCYVDPNGHFHVTVGSVDAEQMVGRNLNKTLKLPFFDLETISRRVGNTYANADILYVRPGDHPPGTSIAPAKVTVVGGSHGSFRVPYAEPAFSGTFRC